MLRETEKKNSFSVKEFGFYDQFGNYLPFYRATNISEHFLHPQCGFHTHTHTHTLNLEMIMCLNSRKHGLGHGCGLQ